MVLVSTRLSPASASRRPTTVGSPASRATGAWTASTRATECLELARAQLERGEGEQLVELADGAGRGYRGGHGRLGEQPGECDRGLGCPVRAGHLVQRCEHGEAVLVEACDGARRARAVDGRAIG